MVNKIIGYILLVLGLALIFWTLFQSYNIFTDKTSAPLVFKTQTEQAVGSNNSFDLASQINQAVRGQLDQILPAATITKILNLVAWSLLSFILIIAGGTVSRIGVRLIK
ncbi:MAG: hypothetical protein ABIJ84_01080 [bacterium]